MKKTILRPDCSLGNPYINIVRECVEDSGYEVISMDKLKSFKGLFMPISIVNLNWYENLFGNTFIINLLSFAKKKIFIIFIKWVKRSKVVVTIHNRFDHNGWSKLSVSMLRFLIFRADKVVCLCNETEAYLKELLGEKYNKKKIDLKLVQMFLPNYSGYYPTNSDDYFDEIRGERSSDTLELLYFGRIEEYKNVPALVELASRIKEFNIHISIVGDGKKHIVERLIDDVNEMENITFVPQYIPADRMWGLIKNADCIVLPYKADSVLNSGAVILAYTVGRNVICPEIGTTMEFPKEYTYTYSADGGIEELYECVMNVYNEYRSDRALFNEKAERIHEIILEKNSKDVLRKKIGKLYSELSESR